MWPGLYLLFSAKAHPHIRYVLHTVLYTRTHTVSVSALDRMLSAQPDLTRRTVYTEDTTRLPF